MSDSKYRPKSRASKLYLTMWECTDLPYGSPVYMSDGLYIWPNGDIDEW